jgi:hypothetical protein
LSALLGLACTALALSIGGLWAVTGLAISASESTIAAVC